MKAVKIYTMGLLAAISWIAGWYFLKLVIYQDQTPAFITGLFFATILGITFLTFFLLINKNRTITFTLDIIILAAYIFLMPKDLYVILGGVIFFIFLFLFEQRLEAEEKSRVDFSFRRVMSSSITVTVYALLLLIGFNVYYSTQTDFKADPDAYYRKLGHAAASTVPYFTKNLPGGVDFNQTFGEFAQQQAGSTNPTVINQYKQQFQQQFSVAAFDNETLSDVFAQVAVDKIKQSTAGFEKYFPFIFAIIVTALLWTFAFLVRWAAMVVGWVIFRLFLLGGFFKLGKVQVEVEKLMF